MRETWVAIIEAPRMARFANVCRRVLAHGFGRNVNVSVLHKGWIYETLRLELSGDPLKLSAARWALKSTLREYPRIQIVNEETVKPEQPMGGMPI